MPSELSDLLERGAEQPSGEPDFADLARRGRRRRYTQRTTQGLAVVAVIALTAGVVLSRLRQPEVTFGAPAAGVGAWELVPEAPIGPRTDSAVAADDRFVVVLGGTIDDSATDSVSEVEARDGAVYDTRERTWTLIPAAPLTDVRHVEFLSDGRLMTHETTNNGRINAALYDFGTGQWQETGPSPVTFWEWEVITWTGEELLIWGVTDKGERSVGAIWNPNSGWRGMAAFPLAPRVYTAWSWAGDRLLVWGGVMGNAENGERERVFADGMAYRPDSDKWTPLAESPLEARRDVQGLWTGDEWIVMGGWGAGRPIKGASNRPRVKNQVMEEECDGNACSGSAQSEIILEETAIDGKDFVDGARYDPDSGEWSPVATPPVGMRRVVWLGLDEFKAGGKRGFAEYDPATDTWLTRSDPGLAVDDRWVSTSVGGRTVVLNTHFDTAMVDVNRPRRIGGVVYNDREQRWDSLTEAPTSQRWGAAVTTVGDRLFIWGGASVTRDISDGYQSPPSPWKIHADGAILTLD